MNFEIKDSLIDPDELLSGITCDERGWENPIVMEEDKNE